MRTTTLGLALLVVLASAPMVAFAQDEKPTHFTADLGYVKTGGNSDVTTLSAADKLEHVSGRWKLTQDAGAVWAETDGVESAGRYGFQLRGDRALAERLSAYALAAWKRNTFAGISHQFDEGVGLVFKVIAAKPQALDLELGASLIQRNPTIGPDDSFVSARTGARYTYDFSEKSQLAVGGYYNINLEDTEDSDGQGNISLTAPVARSMALKVGYDVLYRNRPLPGLEKTDTTVTVGIQIII